MVKLDLKIADIFFQEECRDGYVVSKKMKGVWAVELDLLDKFIKVCDKYQLNYFAESGTLLGAVRHKGFIPWDDDIDIVMMRDDYIKLCEVAPEEFKNPYFFQTEDTDPGSIRGHAQLRNSSTTGILRDELEKKYTFNQGIFIDIFPMDKLPNLAEEKTFFERLQYLKKKSREFAECYQRRGIFDELNPYYQEMEFLCQKYNNSKNARQVGTISFSGGRRDMVRRLEDYRESEEMQFEMLKIKVPVGYNRILAEQYKNWREYVIGVCGHGTTIFDINKSYREFLNE